MPHTIASYGMPFDFITFFGHFHTLLKTGELLENLKKNQVLHIFLLSFSLNKFSKIILSKLIMQHLWRNVAA